MHSALQKIHPANLAHLRHHPMLHDSISVAALSVAVISSVIVSLLLLVKVHHVDYPVPTHYLNLVGFDQVGGWYETYRIALFAWLVTIVNASLAAKSFQRNRLTSFFLLLGAAAVSIFCVVIGLAFAVIV
jgi:hypothetical protein